MKKFWNPIRALLCFSVAAFPGLLSGQNRPPADAAKGAAVLLTIENKVEASRAGAAQWTPAQTNQSLNTGDKVRTGLRSRATMRLSDLGVVRVDQLTALEIQAPQSAGKPPVMDQKGGSIYFFNREKPADVQFRTPVASGAILGTEFHLAVGPDGKTVLTLLDGVVNLSNPQGELKLQSGEQATVELGQPPRKTAMIDAVNIIQWSLYYPAVLDPDELNLDAGVKQAVGDSLSAYRSGDLLAALAAYPDGRQPASDAERIFLAAMLLSVGRVEETEAALNGLQSPAPAALALRKLIAAVKNQNVEAGAAPTTATAWMAESYYQQSKSRLERALSAAQAAAQKSPEFGFAWVRVAELEFGFGRTAAASEALNKGLKLSPRNAEALSLKGFLLAAQNRTGAAIAAFDQAIAVDGALGNAWLGRGLCQIRQGRGEVGRRDLQVAATLEPQRAVLRSYLGKAFSYTSDEGRAEKELTRARELDPNDPTSWLYAALLNQQRNRVNDAVEQLEKSKELNDNRALYRSRLLLDQDKAVRSANLAAIYRDAGMTDVSVREASRAVNYDYGSYSAHQFLANSYDTLRDPKLINLRYETPWFSELLVANLLTPVGAGNLSQTISQQEYSRFFEGDHVGVASGTEYFSSGDWVQYGSQYGVFGNTSYAFDAYYRSENGQRLNNDLQRRELIGRFKQQLTPQDSVLLDIRYFDYESGDVTQYYNQDGSIATQPKPSDMLRVKERQEPNLFVGYHHEWAPGVHTLFLGGHLSDNFSLEDPDSRILYLRTNAAGAPTLFGAFPPSSPLKQVFERTFRSDLEAYSVELQQIWQSPRHTLVTGARFQTGSSDTFSEQLNNINYDPPLSYATNVTTDLNRFTIYGYHQWQVHDTLRLTAGVSYDRLEYPENIDTPPINGRQLTRDRVSPKAGVLWTPGPNTHVRGVFTRSLGGVFYDQSIRLEPTQVAGFN
ncbi:MAG TPA: TonB-dependent receptor, partial [Verrucomicrobiae bacterium]